MKPYKILLFILSVFASLALISFVFPENGIEIGGVSVKFEQLSDLIDTNSNKHPDISNILALLPDTVIEETTDIIVDSLAKDSIEAKEADTLKAKICEIQYPDSSDFPLKSFFESLKEIKKTKELIRVLHYGDSQIEGDRITSSIRYNLQSRFGGNGPGLLSAFDSDHYSISIKQSASGNWEKYSTRKPKINHDRFGVMTYFSRFTPIEGDNSSFAEGWMKFTQSKLIYNQTRKFYNCRIYYGYNKNTVTAEIYAGDSLLKVESLKSNNQVSLLESSFDSPPESVKVKFTGKDSPNIYGVTLDGQSGVAVDNIALRGSAGLEFTNMDLNFLSKMYKMMNVRLVILQFGVNVVPNPRKDYKYYENFFYDQLIGLKRMNPDLSVLVIGVSDMARKEKGTYVSYPNIELIRDAQRNAAFRAGCAFWDLYEAMGGQNSMAEWVKLKPPLARKDFTHFNDNGAKAVAEMFCNALDYAFNEWKKLEN